MVHFALDALVDLFAVNCNILRGVDPDAHLVALYAQYRDRDLVADHHGFANSPRQYQHVRAPIYIGNYSGATGCFGNCIAIKHACVQMLLIESPQELIDHSLKNTRIPNAIVATS